MMGIRSGNVAGEGALLVFVRGIKPELAPAGSTVTTHFGQISGIPRVLLCTIVS
jgi:hypothetical protein